MNQTGSSRRWLDRYASSTAFAISCASRNLRRAGYRGDYTADDPRRLAKESGDAKQTRWLLALASICDGGSRTAAARIGGVRLQIVRDWVVRFNAEEPSGLVDCEAPGQAPRLTAEQLAALAQAVEDGPKPYLHGMVRWRLGDLAAWLRDEFGVSVSETTVSRALKRLGLRVLTARPQAHGQDPDAMEAFEKNFPAAVAEIREHHAEGRHIAMPEAGAIHPINGGQRLAFGAICSKLGKGAALVMPFADTEAMQAHLAEISTAVAPGAHAVLVQAGWHVFGRLAVPDNITLLPLPPRSPELNLVENLWQFMRQNRPSNRVFDSYDDIVAHCCEAWNRVVDQPWRIMSLDIRDWVHGF